MPTSKKVVVYADMAPDLSDDLDPGRVTARFFRETSDINPHTSHIQTKTWFASSISFDLEPDITISTSWNIAVLADLHSYL